MSELRFAEFRPCFRKRAPLFERVAAPISLLGLVAKNVGERGFCNLAGKFRSLASPIAKGRADPMNREISDADTPHNHREPARMTCCDSVATGAKPSSRTGNRGKFPGPLTLACHYDGAGRISSARCGIWAPGMPRRSPKNS